MEGKSHIFEKRVSENRKSKSGAWQFARIYCWCWFPNQLSTVYFVFANSEPWVRNAWENAMEDWKKSLYAVVQKTMQIGANKQHLKQTRYMQKLTYYFDSWFHPVITWSAEAFHHLVAFRDAVIKVAIGIRKYGEYFGTVFQTKNRARMWVGSHLHDEPAFCRSWQTSRASLMNGHTSVEPAVSFCVAVFWRNFRCKTGSSAWLFVRFEVRQ